MKNLLTCLLFFVNLCLFAQVGVNTTNPEASLDILGAPNDTTTPDGIIAPRITGDQLRAKTSYGAAQEGALIYVTAADSAPVGQTINVTDVGYYYFDGTLWQATITVGAVTDNIYTADGTLTANRAVTQGNLDLNFDANTLVVSGDNDRVGIGTANPGVKLDIIDAINPTLRIGTPGASEGAIEFGNFRHGVKRNFAGSNNDVGLYTDFGDLHLSANAEITGELTLTEAGNVGIGTATPPEKLSVEGKIATLSNLEIGQLGTGDRNSFIDLQATDSGDFESRFFRFAGANGALLLENKGTGNIRFDVRESGNTSDLVIDGSTANVGIGTNAPSSKLDVVGNARIRTVPAGVSADGVITTDANGNLRQRTAAQVVEDGGAVTDNLYTADGTLTANRAVTQGNLDLNFDANTLVVSGDNDRVGIGTANPGVKLDIIDAINPTLRIGTPGASEGAIEFGNFRHGVKRNFAGSNNDVGLYTDFGDLHLSANAEIAGELTLTEAGNVGIGTATPLTKLHVTGRTLISPLTTSSFTDDLEVRNVGGSASSTMIVANNINEDFFVRSQAGATTSNIDIASDNSLGRLRTQSNFSQLQLFGPDKSLELVSSNIENSIRSLSAGGNSRIIFQGEFVGINTIPSVTLDVNGQVRVRALPNGLAADGIISTDANGNLRQRTAAQVVAAGGGNLYSTNGTLTANRAVTQGNFDLNFDANTLVVSGDDNRVGIGTPNPSQKLHVIGNILASGTITPDYVFESFYHGTSTLNPDYKMMNLEQIEAFTKKNKHLPGIASAKEVEQTGGILINRATEINLEKIEELFLHTIQQEKKLNILITNLSITTEAIDARDKQIEKLQLDMKVKDQLLLKLLDRLDAIETKLN